MEINKIINQTSWMISASKEQMKFLYKEVKSLMTFTTLVNLVQLNKSIYHLNMSRVLLNQLEKNYAFLLSSNTVNSSKILKLKNTYLQRCVFQYLLGFDYYKEIHNQIDMVSIAINKSNLYKWNMLNGLLNKLIDQFDNLLRILNK